MAPVQAAPHPQTLTGPITCTGAGANGCVISVIESTSLTRWSCEGVWNRLSGCEVAEIIGGRHTIKCK